MSLETVILEVLDDVAHAAEDHPAVTEGAARLAEAQAKADARAQAEAEAREKLESAKAAKIAEAKARADEKARIERALARLTPEERAVLVLRELEGHPYEEIATTLDGCVTLAPMAPDFAPIVYAAPAQLLAYHAAVFMGKDVDQPRNLAKSVTVE